jgi:hypothetical protein
MEDYVAGLRAATGDGKGPVKQDTVDLVSGCLRGMHSQ